MVPTHLTSADQCDASREVAAKLPGGLRKLCGQLKNRLRHSWRLGWLKCSGPDSLGRIAARLASWNTMPYHGRAFLADLTPRGFIASSAAVAHPDLRLGDHVYIGDNVIVTCCKAGGALELRDRVQLYGNTFLQTGAGGSITIGEGTHVQPGCHIHAFLSGITIGKSVEIAAGCGFYCYDHGTDLGQLIMEQPLKSKGGISVGDGAWLGYQVTVLQGVSIGAGAVIAAGSVVVHDIPENAIAAGIPARVIKFRMPASL